MGRDYELKNAQAFFNWLEKLKDDTHYKRSCAWKEGNLGSSTCLACQEEVLNRVIVRYKEVLL